MELILHRIYFMFWVFMFSWFTILFLKEKENNGKRVLLLVAVIINIVNVTDAYIDAFIRFK